MVKVFPVISEAASLRRSVTASAMSSGSPNRPMGILDSSSAAHSGRLSVVGVSSLRTKVGASALTRIPACAHSGARNLGEVDQAGFAGAVGGAFLDADDSCLRGEVDDGALGSAFDPVPGRGGAQEEAAWLVSMTLSQSSTVPAQHAGGDDGVVMRPCHSGRVGLHFTQRNRRLSHRPSPELMPSQKSFQP